MKKIIFFCFILLTSLTTINAQRTSGYVSLANSGNDKLQYLINNFENQEAKYIGQPLTTLFNDLELEIQGSLKLEQIINSGNDFSGLSLMFFNPTDYSTLSLEERNEFYANMKNFEIYVKTIEPLKAADNNAFADQYGSGWSPEMETFYSSYTVKSVKVVGYRDRQ